MIAFSYDYDRSYAGPALPVVEVILHSLENDSKLVEPHALVDSGADATIVPLEHLQQIGARRVDNVRLKPLQGPSYRVDIYEVGLQIGNYHTLKVYAAADTQNEGVILGRDVLNHFIVTLNGLAAVVEISQ